MTGTILHGAASLRETDDATYSANFRNIYGLTDQNASFTIEQEGVGHTTKEATWLVYSFIAIFCSCVHGLSSRQMLTTVPCSV